MSSAATASTRSPTVDDDVDELRREIREKIPLCDDCGLAMVPGREGCHSCPE